MNLLAFLILILATWRIASLLTNEDGPSQLLAAFRHTAIKYTRLFDCLWCCSFWVGLVVALAYYFYPVITLAAALPFALSAGAIVADRYING